jgi:hypothetical protein
VGFICSLFRIQERNCANVNKWKIQNITKFLQTKKTEPLHLSRGYSPQRQPPEAVE